MGLSRQEYWSGLPCPFSGDLPNTGIEPRSPALQADSSPAEPPRKPLFTLLTQVYSPKTPCNTPNTMGAPLLFHLPSLFPFSVHLSLCIYICILYTCFNSESFILPRSYILFYRKSLKQDFKKSHFSTPWFTVLNFLTMDHLLSSVAW